VITWITFHPGFSCVGNVFLIMLFYVHANGEVPLVILPHILAVNNNKLSSYRQDLDDDKRAWQKKDAAFLPWKVYRSNSLRTYDEETL